MWLKPLRRKQRGGGIADNTPALAMGKQYLGRDVLPDDAVARLRGEVMLLLPRVVFDTEGTFAARRLANLRAEVVEGFASR